MASLRTIDAFTSPIDAFLAKGRLEVEGIPAYIAHENHIWANWMYSQALGGVKLQVPASAVDEAREVLFEHLNGKFETYLSQEFSDFEVDLCPQCGAEEYKSSVSLFAKIKVILTFIVFDIFYNLRKENHTCSKCGYKWKN